LTLFLCLIADILSIENNGDYEELNNKLNLLFDNSCIKEEKKIGFFGRFKKNKKEEIEELNEESEDTSEEESDVRKVSEDEIITEEKVEEKKVVEEPKKSIATQPEIVEEQDVDLLFLKSETSVDKKAAWMEYYEKALRSKKDNAVTDKLRRGRFRILDDGSFIILPDLDTYQKSSKTLLEENWF